MSTLLAPILQYFFTEHLTSHKQVSPRTIVAYRDSFRLLLQFLKKKTGKQPSTLCVDDLDASAILDFLEHLEEPLATKLTFIALLRSDANSNALIASVSKNSPVRLGRYRSSLGPTCRLPSGILHEKGHAAGMHCLCYRQLN
jgi:hypothetical protein